MSSIPLVTARHLVAVALERAAELGVLVSAAVVDDGGHLVDFSRMDGAEVAGPTLAVDKAFTAVANSISTAALAIEAAPGGPLFGLHSAAGGRYVIFGGGVPVLRDGVIVGALGVSGAAPDEDDDCARAGVDAYAASFHSRDHLA